MISLKEVREGFKAALPFIGLVVSICSGLSNIANHKFGLLFWGSCVLMAILLGYYLFLVFNKRRKTTDTSNRSVSEANHLRGI